MARVNNVICDGCGKILLGKDRMADVSETFISIVGSISMQIKEDEQAENRRSYMFLTDNHHQETSFCDLKCIKAYIEVQTVVAKNRREQALRREVEAKQ